MNSWLKLKKSFALFVVFGLVFSLLQAGGFSRIASAATELTNDTIPAGEYEVDYVIHRDGTQEKSAADDYMHPTSGAKGKLIVESNGDIWFEHEVNTIPEYSYFQYLGYLQAGQAKAVIDNDVVQSGADGYTAATFRDGTASTKIVRYQIADIMQDQDILMHIIVPGIGYDHWYNAQIAIDTSGIVSSVPTQYSVLHATYSQFSLQSESYFKKPALVKPLEDGSKEVTLTLLGSNVISDLRVEQDSVYSSVYVVSEDTNEKTRTVRFNVADVSDPVNFKLDVAAPGYSHTYELRFNFNGVNNAVLEDTISAAAVLANSAVVGTEAGEYPQSAVDALKAAIATAHAASENDPDTQSLTDAAVTTLKAAITTFEAAVVGGSTGGNGGGGVVPSTDGYYHVQYAILKDGTNETSVADGYFVKPALLKVQGSSKTIFFTVLRSKEITGLTLNGSSGTVASQNTTKNTRVMSFQVYDLSAKINATIKVDWDEGDFHYHHTYTIQFQFDDDTKVQVEGDNPAVPGFDYDGNQGMPNLSNPGDEDEEEATEEGASGGSGSGTGSGSAAIEFSDAKYHWAAAQINRAVKLGIVKGFEDGSFRPNAVVSRGEFTAMIARALKLTNTGAATSFTDAGQIPAWAKEYAVAAEQAGLIGGFSDGTFRSGAEITRAQLAVIIVRAAKLETKSDAALGFADADKIPAWAGKEIAAAVEAGLITGKDNNRFDPDAPATRAESLTLIIRLLDYLAEQDEQQQAQQQEEQAQAEQQDEQVQAEEQAL
ncbi:NEAT domain-containing protein [Cohnella fermenti]|uniref:S-layer homology domain-containing protein n=1 Tax=Cohnella fermenti TaxID=2565925 RepID=A0A4S4C6E3_9BACL|nr:NEAT domain-containing protein [Cohnella fermenti]THF83459.1 hypothetical protein E6C55_04670 [Cohnella fermenti]